MEFLFSYELVLVFVTLTFLEIILGIDNLIFISLVVAKLPQEYRDKARYIGVGLALIMRVIMLLTLSWIISLTEPLFVVFALEFSWRNVLLILGGIFLIVKSMHEIHQDIKANMATRNVQKNKTSVKKEIAVNSFGSAVIQVIIVDFVFSFDSIITAIGMTNNIPIIIAAVVISMIVMLVAADKISQILIKYPSLKIMALAFIFMIGVILLAEGMHMEIAKGYLYFSLFFAMAVEYLNIISGSNSNGNAAAQNKESSQK